MFINSKNKEIINLAFSKCFYFKKPRTSMKNLHNNIKRDSKRNKMKKSLL